MRPKKQREVAIHARYVNYIADFKPEKHLSPFRWKYIFIFCKLNHSFTLAKPSVSWGSFCNDLHWKREHLQIICSKKKNIFFLNDCCIFFLARIPTLSPGLRRTGHSLVCCCPYSLASVVFLAGALGVGNLKVKNQVGFGGDSAWHGGWT